jgi:NAD(P)-dependent dehydrogenase (short-subunit alcohol dehydrogenase family)
MAAEQKRVVLVTGASSGIGRCCAEFLAQQGYRVYGASRRPASSPLIESISMDVGNDASVRHAVAGLLERERRIDIVVNNAGIAIAGAVEDTSIDEAREQFEVNFFGVLRVCRAVLPRMRQQRAGYVVNVGSIAGLIAVPYQGLYSASKFALEGFSESLRLELRRFGIHVVLIEPGDHPTGLTDNRRKTADSETSAAYRDRFNRAIDRMAADERGGPDPQAIARLLHRIVRHPRPRLRYTVGPARERAAAWMKRLMPYAVVEKAMDLYYSQIVMPR